jgi:hypothetical protein
MQPFKMLVGDMVNEKQKGQPFLFLDTSINMAMQPFKMLVGDMVNEKQKGLAYSIQSFLCNAGSLMGYLFPFIFTFIGISNTADKGTVPDSVWKKRWLQKYWSKWVIRLNLNKVLWWLNRTKRL